MRHVQLVEARSARAIRLAHVLDAGTPRRGEAVGQAQLAGNFGDGRLAGGVVDLVDADGGEPDGCGDGVSEDGCAGVAVVGVDELVGDYAVAVEGLAVCEVCVGLAGVGGGVEPASLAEFLFGLFFEFGRVYVVVLCS